MNLGSNEHNKRQRNGDHVKLRNIGNWNPKGCRQCVCRNGLEAEYIDDWTRIY